MDGRGIVKTDKGGKTTPALSQRYRMCRPDRIRRPGSIFSRYPLHSVLMDVLYGLHPVEEALRAGIRADRPRQRGAGAGGPPRPTPRRRPRALPRTRGIRISAEPREQLTRHCKTDAHQGVVAFLRERKFLALEDLLRPRPAKPSVPL